MVQQARYGMKVSQIGEEVSPTHTGQVQSICVCVWGGHTETCAGAAASVGWSQKQI